MASPSLLISIIVVLTSLRFAACGTSQSSSRGDVPQFADGEAIAVVKERLLSTLPMQCLYEYRNTTLTWDSAYLGNGAWSVTAGSGYDQGEWRVYERTISVDQLQSPFYDC